MTSYHLHHCFVSFRTDPSVMDMSVSRSTGRASATLPSLDHGVFHLPIPATKADLYVSLLISTTFEFPFSP